MKPFMYYLLPCSALLLQACAIKPLTETAEKNTQAHRTSATNERSATAQRLILRGSLSWQDDKTDINPTLTKTPIGSSDSFSSDDVSPHHSLTGSNHSSKTQNNHGHWRLQPCGSDISYPIQLSAKQQKALNQLKINKDRPVYAEILGQFVNPNARTKLNQLNVNVNHLNFVTAENPNRCHIDREKIRVIGKEAPWAITLDSAKLTLSQWGQTKEILPLKTIELSADKQIFHLDNAKLILTNTYCSDTMSDSLYGWSAQWQYQGKTQQGCVQTINKATKSDSTNTYHDQGAQWTSPHTTSNKSVSSHASSLHIIQTPPHSSSTTQKQQLQPQRLVGNNHFDPNVDKALRHYFKSNKTDPESTRYLWQTYDLTRTGQKALFVLLDWCGSGGCTLLIFEPSQKGWQYNSRVTLVRSPIYLGSKQSHGWQDLIVFVSGGGAKAQYHRLSYNGRHYPINPSLAPVVTSGDISQNQLFADKKSPVKDGLIMK